MKLTEEQIIGMSEAYQSYLLLDDEDKKKIPNSFVKKMERCYDIIPTKLMLSPEDVRNTDISREGVKIMAYMSLLLKE